MAKVCLRTYLRRILSLYDLLNGDGIGGGNILKKRLLTLCFDYRNFEHSDMSSEHSTIDAILYVDMHTNSPNRFLLWRVLVYISYGVGSSLLVL